MKTTTIILSAKQVDMLLNNLPQGHQIRVKAEDLNKIIDRAKKASK